MKKNILYLLSVILVITIISCNKKETSPSEKGKLKVGLVFDVGGKGDKSFNDAAYKGLERAKLELGIDYEIIDPGDGSDRESALRRLSSRNDIELIFGVGFIFTDDITQIATEFPDKKFACVDYTINPEKKIPENLLALEFREEEGSFLVGAIAGLMTKTNKVGFLGGMESALIKKFEYGFTQGVKYVNPDCKILTAYISVTGEGFKNAPKAKEIALTQYSNGADIVYHASGLSGVGLFEAAKEVNKYAIGVDLDQYNEAPGQIITSMTKQVDEVIFLAVKDYKEGKFSGGTRILGLKEKGVDYVFDENNKNLLTEEIINKVETIREKIINGEIIVITQ